MARLPVPGSDDNVWGDILNTYLSQSLAADGTIKADTISDTQLAPNSVTTSALAVGAVAETQLSTAVQTKLNAPAPVESVAGKTGAVTLDISNIASLQAALDQLSSDISALGGRVTTIESSDTATQDAASLATLESDTNTLQSTYRQTVADRLAAATVFTESWQNTSAWTGTGTVLSGRVYSSSALSRALPASQRWVVRTTLKTTGVQGRYAYIGVSPDMVAANSISFGQGSSSTNAFVNRGSNIAAPAVTIPRSLPSLAAGDYLLTVAADETYVSFTLQKPVTGQYLYGFRVARSAFPAALNYIFITADDPLPGGMTFGPLVMYSEMAVPPLASRTVGGVQLFGTDKPLVFMRAAANGYGQLIALPGDMDPTVQSPLVMYAHQSLTGEAFNLFDDTRWANVLSALHTAGYVICASDNGPSTAPGGTQDRYGNLDGLNDYATLISWARQLVSTGKLFLLGTSMGAYFVLNMIHRRQVGGIAAAAIISGSPNLRMGLQNATYRTALLDAYAATSETDFAQKSSGFEPSLERSSKYRGLPMRFYEGTSDTTLGSLAQDIQPFVDRLAPLAPEVSLITGAVGHLDASLYKGSDLTSFFNVYK